MCIENVKWKIENVYPIENCPCKFGIQLNVPPEQNIHISVAIKPDNHDLN